jgi:hypothetical protein
MADEYETIDIRDQGGNIPGALDTLKNKVNVGDTVTLYAPFKGYSAQYIIPENKHIPDIFVAFVNYGTKEEPDIRHYYPSTWSVQYKKMKTGGGRRTRRHTKKSRRHRRRTHRR